MDAVEGVRPLLAAEPREVTAEGFGYRAETTFGTMNADILERLIGSWLNLTMLEASAAC